MPVLRSDRLRLFVLTILGGLVPAALLATLATATPAATALATAASAATAPATAAPTATARAGRTAGLAAPAPTAPAATASATATIVAPASTEAALASHLDSLLVPLFKADEPGGVVLVARNGKPVYRRGFGLADLEKKTPMPADAVFRIGSVTKQFTAAAILRLAEQGKLSVRDEITKYLPDFPTRGKTITIEHLLTHTSGIMGYTELPEWHDLMTQAMSVAEMVELIGKAPLQFEPGEKWAYSNSGYFLLGAIIEKVSGKTYAEYIRSEILEPLAMSRSGYGKDVPSFPGEVGGYAKNGDSLAPADSISMTTPYAAGSLVSSVDDLLKWDEGLYGNKLLNEASRKALFTSGTLRDGKPTHYAYGFLLSEYEGHPIVEHNGGINGFLVHALRMPEDHVYVAVLMNSETPQIDPGYVALQAAALAIGKPMPQPGAHPQTVAQLDRFVGVYEIDSTMTRTISREGDKLYSQRKGGGKLEIFPVTDSTFAFAGRPARLTFHLGPGGAIAGLTLHQGGITEDARRTDRPVPAPRVAIQLDPASLDAYTGNYELAPNFILAITREGSSLMAQATGQPKIEIFPESETSFFLKVVDAQIVFQKGADGKIESLTLHQGGRQMPGKRVS